MTPSTRPGSAPGGGADAVSTPDPDELDFLLDILAAALACLDGDDVAERIAGCGLIGAVAWPMVTAADDDDFGELWEAGARVEHLAAYDRSAEVRQAARRAFDAIHVVWQEVGQ